MVDVEALIVESCEYANPVVLASQEHHEWNLRYCQPCRSDAHRLIMLGTRVVSVGKFECEDKCKIGNDEQT